MQNNKVKIIDDAIDTSVINRFINVIDKKKFINIDKSSYAHTQTNFQTKFYKDNFHINPLYSEIRSSITKRIEKELNIKLPIPVVYRNFILKYNEPGMRSAMHVEHNDIHGNLGFLFYLATENSGYLRWVDQDGEDDYFQKYPDEKDSFVDNYSYRQLYGNIEVQPRYNRLVIFETFGSHFVEMLDSSKNQFPRLCIMGWPFCKV